MPGNPASQALVSSKPTSSADKLSHALALRKRPDPQTSTTSKALILRNGKQGVRGTGELTLAKKLSGEEKLALKAREVESQALKSPFKMDSLLQLARSQVDIYLDQINQLHHVDFFHDKILAAFASTPEALPRNQGGKPDAFRDPTFIARVIGSRIHNAYLMSASWKIVHTLLLDLQEAGIDDFNIRHELNDPSIRDQYLVLYDTVNMLVSLSQDNMALMATASPQYAQFFKASQSDSKIMEFASTVKCMLAAHKSFIDTIILEIVLPKSRYSLHVLVACLHDALETTQKEDKRFTQALYDAVGDLSVALQALDLLGAPLANLEGREWLAAPRGEMSANLDDFYKAINQSAIASQNIANFKSLVFPFTKTKSASVLDQVWKCINLNYKATTGKDIDHLWQLQDDRVAIPQWTCKYLMFPPQDESSDEFLSDTEIPKPGSLVRYKKNANPPPAKKAALRLTAGPHTGSDNELPELITTDDSEDGEGGDVGNSSEEDEDYDEDLESDWDMEEEREVKKLITEALRTNFGQPSHVQQPKPPNHDLDSKTNPFMKMFSRLAGRMFSSDPTLKARGPPKTTQKAAGDETDPDLPPLEPYNHPRKYPVGVDSDDELPPLVPIPGKTQTEPHSHKTTIEEVEDEDDLPKKKKKKKPKKKKKADTANADPPPSPTPRPLTPPAPPSNSVKPRTSLPSSSQPGIGPAMSTASLALSMDQKARSARSYLQSELPQLPKVKIKSRPAPNTAPDTDTPTTSSKFWGFGKKKKETEDSKAVAVADEKRHEKTSMFKKVVSVPKKAVDLISRVLGGLQDEKVPMSGMKWDQFVKAMQALGFGVDPSTAGSSVRFIPPNPQDGPISFHKPHPDPTISPVRLKEYGYRLRQRYGWSREMFEGFEKAAMQEEEVE